MPAFPQWRPQTTVNGEKKKKMASLLACQPLARQPPSRASPTPVLAETMTGRRRWQGVRSIGKIFQLTGSRGGGSSLGCTLPDIVFGWLQHQMTAGTAGIVHVSPGAVDGAAPAATAAAATARHHRQQDDDASRVGSLPASLPAAAVRSPTACLPVPARLLARPSCQHTTPARLAWVQSSSTPSCILRTTDRYVHHLFAFLPLPLSLCACFPLSARVFPSGLPPCTSPSPSPVCPRYHHSASPRCLVLRPPPPPGQDPGPHPPFTGPPAVEQRPSYVLCAIRIGSESLTGSRGLSSRRIYPAQPRISIYLHCR